MSSGELVPQLLKALAVAKPQREGWLLEELYDLLAPMDESAKVERSEFHDVLLVLSERLQPSEICRAAQRMEFSFMSRLVPAMRVVKAAGRAELLSALQALVPSGKRLGLMVSLRGRGKELVRVGELAEYLKARQNSLSRQSREVVVVESVGDLFVLSYGITLRCGLGCTLVVPLEPYTF
ncbi:MAG: hypothetical protein NZ902_03375 [Acidilobaceae archaeon]|nr:hypothetical protein [Acidilobaceae archaeon]MCX8165860.1 hypothetical protein [Acidilobaceae archaeon]MDW7974868.1 hypothetical protein [Sulfolobales archaeon]